MTFTNANLIYEIRSGIEMIKIFQENVGDIMILKRLTDEEDRPEIIIKMYDRFNQKEIADDIDHYVMRGFEFETFKST